MNSIRELRKRKGLTMKQFGDIVGLSESTISLYERGKHEPDLQTLKTIADFFGVTIDYLMGREEPPKEASSSRDERRAKMEEILRRMPQDKYDQALAILEVLAAEQKKEG